MRTLILSSLSLALLLSTPLRANDVDVAARLKVLKEKNRPAVLVTPNKKVRRIELHLTRDDGKKVNTAVQKPKLGKQAAIEFDQDIGVHSYKGELVVVFSEDNEAAMPLEFTVEVTSGQFAVNMTENDLDLAGKTGTVRIGCEVDKLDIEIDGEDGVLAQLTTEHHGAPPNTPLTFRWEQKPGPVLRIVIKPTCSDGVFKEQHFFPWSYPIEHEEVRFASGSDVIAADEAVKLDASYQAIAQALAKYGKWGKPNLYIAGHTDTVADKGFNRDLSNRRARSIASAFKKKGLQVDVYYLGFGEEAPLVPTPDNTDEPRNRRAEYIISVNEPRVEIQGFDGHWNRLR
ncbi:MAG: OmpA family protein [Pseudomonadota bacterium]